ncbi:MAG: hypothetical protein ACXWL2_00440 [Candidatus Chromulinivorax sp.]
MHLFYLILFFSFLTNTIHGNNKPTVQDITQIQTLATGVLAQYCDNLREKKLYKVDNCQEILSKEIAERLSVAQIQAIIETNPFKEQKIFNHIGLQVIENQDIKMIKVYLKDRQFVLQQEDQTEIKQNKSNMYLFEQVADFYDVDVSDHNRYKNYQSYFFSKK